MNSIYFFYSVPFLIALLFLIIKEISPISDEFEITNFLAELILLSVINYGALFLFYLPQIEKRPKINPITSMSESIITGPPKFFPYQKV